MDKRLDYHEPEMNSNFNMLGTDLSAGVFLTQNPRIPIR